MGTSKQNTNQLETAALSKQMPMTGFFLELPSTDATKEMLRDIDHFKTIEYIQGSKVNVALKTAR